MTFLATLTAPPPSKLTKSSSNNSQPSSPGVQSNQNQNQNSQNDGVSGSKPYGKDVDEFTSLLWVPGNTKLNDAVKEEKSKIEYLVKNGMKNKADQKRAQQAVNSTVKNFNCHHIFAGDSAGRIVDWQFNLNDFDDLIVEPPPPPPANNSNNNNNNFGGGDEFFEQNHTMGNSLSSLVGEVNGQITEPRRGPNFNPHRLASAEISLSSLRSFNRSQFLAVTNKKKQMKQQQRQQQHQFQKHLSSSSSRTYSAQSFQTNDDDGGGGGRRASGQSIDAASKTDETHASVASTLSGFKLFGSVRRCSGQWVAHGTGLPPRVPPGSTPGTPPPPNPVIQSLHWIPYKPSSYLQSNKYKGSSRAPSGNRKGGGNDTSSSSSSHTFSFGHFNNLLCSGGGVLLSASNDGTSRLWMFHQDPQDNTSLGAGGAGGSTTVGGTAAAAAASRSRHLWRVPKCLGELDSHNPEPAQQHGPTAGFLVQEKPSTKDIPWQFDPHTVQDTEKVSIYLYSFI
jgi:hypothetical protein